MENTSRRGFVKGATLGALAFTVGGVEILMAPGEAKARGVPFRLLDAHQGETLEALGETLVPSGARVAAWLTSSISSFRCRRRKACCRRASSTSVRPS